MPCPNSPGSDDLSALSTDELLRRANLLHESMMAARVPLGEVVANARTLLPELARRLEDIQRDRDELLDKLLKVSDLADRQRKRHRDVAQLLTKVSEQMRKELGGDG